MTRISDMTLLAGIPPSGLYTPVERSGSTTNYRVDLGTLSSPTPQMYAEACGLGPLGLGIQDDSPAFVAAIAALKLDALNTGTGGFYKGSRSLFVPAGHYYLGTTTLDINHTLIIQGEGSGVLGPGAFGCTQLRWAAGTNGIRVQHPNTSGNAIVDVTTHDGAGGVCLADMCLEGGFNGTTEGDYHGLVLRSAIKGSNLYIKNWPGEAVKGWAGIVNGTNYGGNASTTFLSGVKCENNRGGFDFRGTDSNVCTFLNCEAIGNRQFGYLDDNGAGSNTVIGMHCSGNGLATGTWPQTQCANSGNRYALKWGGDPTVAPSGTTADTANWLYVSAGAAVANTIPAWVSTAGTFRAGGDYLTINNAGVLLVNCYQEGGGFSQFNSSTLIEHGAIAKAAYRGGWRFIPQSEGLAFKTTGLGNFLFENDTEIGLFAQDSASTAYGYIDWVKGSGAYYSSHTGHNFRIDGSTVSSIDASGNYSVGANKVVGARKTGWAVDTGTSKRTTNATYAAGTTLAYSATYVQAEQTAMATRMAAVEAALQNLSQTQKALKDDLHGTAGHGLIGT